MKISIGYKLFKKKIINRKVYIIFLSFFILLELSTFLFVNNKPEEVKNEIVDEKREVTLSDAIEELKNKEISVLTAKKEKDTYLIDIKVEGSRDIVLKKIGELVNYKINDFNIDFNNNIITGKVALKYSPKGEF